MSSNHKSTIASTNRSSGSIHFTVRSTKLDARALPKGKLLCLPRDTVEVIEELSVILERLALLGTTYLCGMRTTIFLGQRAVNFPHYLCGFREDERRRDKGMSPWPNPDAEIETFEQARKGWATQPPGPPPDLC
jgi:hypothetical protein